MPVLCPVRRLTGHRCPGCGMTRGLVYMFRLRLGRAFAANPLSPLVFALLILVAIGREPRLRGKPPGQVVALESDDALG